MQGKRTSAPAAPFTKPGLIGQLGLKSRRIAVSFLSGIRGRPTCLLRLSTRRPGLAPLGNECALELGETGHDAEDRL